jgi:predicted permease
LGGPFVIEGRPDQSYAVDINWVSEHYFEVFRIPLRRGRPFTNLDTSLAPPIVLINETLDHGLSRGFGWTAPLLWRNGNPLGERITFSKGEGPPFEDRTREIIGVVGAVRSKALGREANPMVYIPIGQLPDALVSLISHDLPLVWTVRTKTDPSSFRTAIERELRMASGGLPVAEIRAMTQVMANSTAREHFNTMLLSVFAGLALLLAAIGIYGVMAYAVQLRTKEIGIRIALGARPGDVSRMVVIDGMTLALVGVGFGVLAALVLTPLMRSLLYGVAPSDPGTLVLVAAVLSAVALLATYIPAHRATLIDPILTLRWE